MTVDEKLDLLLSEITGLKEDVTGLKYEASDIKERLEPIQATCLKVEQELLPNMRILLENHCDLVKRVNVTNDIDSRVDVLEFEMKIVKEMLNVRFPAN